MHSGACSLCNISPSKIYNSGDSEALAKLIESSDINNLKEIGKYSREGYFKKYSKNYLLINFQNTLTALPNYHSLFLKTAFYLKPINSKIKKEVSFL